MNSDTQFITAPTSQFGELLLTTVDTEPTPFRGTLRTLADPTTYGYVLDHRRYEQM